jgi:peptidoglycan/xylan/chitin deacetylase (PgdA/CDA1 family)
LNRNFRIHKALPVIILLQLFAFSYAKAQPTINPNIFQCQAATWYGNKFAAVSFTFDDGPLCQFQTGLNLLNNFGFKGTYFIITNYVDSSVFGVTWDTVRRARSFGNEIASHTVSHADLSVLTNTAAKQDSLRIELGHSKQRIEAEVPTQKCLSLAYPWTKYNDTVRQITSQYYMSARSAGYPESKNPQNFYSLAGTVIWTATTANDLNFYMNYCISRGEWFIEMIHGIDAGGWQPVPHTTYYNHFSYIKARENIIWVAPVQDIVKYIKERQNLVFSNKQFYGDSLSFDVTDHLNDSLYNFPVTVIVTPPPCLTQIDSITQNNTNISFNYVPFSWTHQIYFNIYPDSGKVRIYGKMGLLPKPILKVTGATTFCEGDSVILKGYDKMQKYIWSNKDSVEKIVVKTSGTYTLSMVDQNGCSTMTSDSLKITVYPAPQKPEIISTKSFNLCEGDTTIIETSLPYYKYLWSTGSSDSALTVHKSGLFSVTVTDTNNCVNRSKVTELKVNPLPPAPTITMFSKSSFCVGDSSVLSASPGYKKYHWSTGDTQQILTVREYKTIPYSVMVIDKNNCPSSFSKIVYLPYNFSKFRPNVRLYGKPAFCEGDSVILTAEEDKYRFNWNTREASRSIIIKKSGNYSVTLVNEYNCKSEPSDVVSINTFQKPEKPTVKASGTTKLCEGDSIYLSAKRDLYEYKWSNGEHGSKINIKISGIYSLTTINGNGCRSTESDDVMVLFTTKPEKPRILEGSMSTIESSVSGDDYYWYLDDVYLGINSQSINPAILGSGNYSVRVSNNECFSDTSEHYYFYIPTTGIQEEKINEDLSLFPNPNNGSFYVNFNFALRTEGNLEIFNNNGKLLFDKLIPGDLKKLKINLPDQTIGTCLLVYTSGSKKITKKFTVKRN